MRHSYRSFLNLFVGQIAAALANVRAYEAERQRAEALAEIDRAKTVFFSNVSHEFRTPLTLMLGPLEDARGPRRSRTTTCAANSPSMRRNGARLLRLVNTLLDFSRIEAGRAQARYEPDRSRRVHARARQHLRLGHRTGGTAAGGRVPASRASRCTSIAACGKRWCSICCRTRSSTRSTANRRRRAAGGRPAFELRGARHGYREFPPHEMPRLFERFHRVAAARRAKPRRIGHWTRARAGTRANCTAAAVEVESVDGAAARSRSRYRSGVRILPANQVHESTSHSISETEANLFVEEALQWMS